LPTNAVHLLAIVKNLYQDARCNDKVNNQLHTPAALPQVKTPRYSWNKRL